MNFFCASFDSSSEYRDFILRHENAALYWDTIEVIDGIIEKIKNGEKD